MRNIHFPITQGQMVLLQDKYHTDSKIAKQLNITVSRVCQIRKKYGISLYSINKENKSRNRFINIDFKEAGMSKKELSVKYKLSLMTITRILKSFKGK
jgi:hypothetical protein